MTCLFCKIIAKEIPASIVYEDPSILAFNDIAPQAPTHILVVPKLHAATLNELADFSAIDKLFVVMKKLAQDTGIDKTGYRIVLNQGRDAGQAVSHLHFHLLGGRSMRWPPG